MIVVIYIIGIVDGEEEAGEERGSAEEKHTR